MAAMDETDNERHLPACDDAWEPLSHQDRAELNRLAIAHQAQHLQRQPSASVASATSESKAELSDGKEDAAKEESCDPRSESFSLENWLRRTLGTLKHDGIDMSSTGVVFKNISVVGTKPALRTQSTVGTFLAAPFLVRRIPGHCHHKDPSKTILHDFNGLLESGELLVVLGRPGAGCSTLLRTLTGHMHDIHFADPQSSSIHYNGIPQSLMIKEFRGEVTYNQEIDKHFPHLTVGQTLEHAAALRTPLHRPSAPNYSRQEFAKYITQVFMAAYGLRHTYNTKVGDDYVRGVSGGERKRVSIAEMALARPLLAAWDNSTRGLDSATALTFVKSLRLSADLVGSSHAVAAYQASEAIYELFDKAVVLYEGREIFFGHAREAKAYFERMGWQCHPRQTTADFLSSVTSAAERIPLEGFEQKVPRTPEEFESYWRTSPEYAELQTQIASYEKQRQREQELQTLRNYHRDHQQARHLRPKSPFIVSFPMQVRLNLRRAFQRLWNNKSATFAPILSNAIMALIIGSVYFGSPQATSAFHSKGAVVFFAILLNALTAITEVNGLYEQRPIVEKHKAYAFYHPATEAIASIILDIPLKFMLAVAFNLTLYFMAGLRLAPAQFFLFFLINYTATFAMVAVFRTVAAVTRQVAHAMALAGVLVLAIVVYTGFIIPTNYMRPWFGWIRWVNPIYYAFEALIANEFHGRNFTCSAFVPGPPSVTPGGSTFVCLSSGAVAGELAVSGDAYISTAYGYTYSDFWRNFGILVAFLCAFLACYFVVVEYNARPNSAAEVLVFRKGHVPKSLQQPNAEDEERAAPETITDRQTLGAGDSVNTMSRGGIVTWQNINYDIHIKGEERRLLDQVSGYVKPGVLTALMGTSGAGKTTLLDVLAQRTRVGVVHGDIFANGAALQSSNSFQRRTGYVQQQDLHLETATVRESLLFSASLRIANARQEEKEQHVDEVIRMLDMQDFAEAVVGFPGEGLNVEQRKLLSIGVELAAKPDLLVFLDEPTSGLDSQSAWKICAFLRKLAHQGGQAILCTIHQPSGPLFEVFDRLLFLRKGGHTVYFGDIGQRSKIVTEYFERNGARSCGEGENPAEYLLEVVDQPADGQDWIQVWKDSDEAATVQQEIAVLNEEAKSADSGVHVHYDSEFAAPFHRQLQAVIFRLFQQYWRTPSYILAKVTLGGASGLFIGFSFYKANTTLQGMQNVLFSLFMVITIFITMVQQIMPLFVTQRSLYEVREGPSKTYGWKAFLFSNIIVELPYQIFTGVVVFGTFFFAVVGTGQSSERQGLAVLYCIVFFIYASTFAHMCIAAIPDAQTASAIGSLFFGFSLIFNGVMQPPSQLGWWIWMYRLSPLTYWVSGMSSTMLHGRRVECARSEVSIFDPPVGETCGNYLARFTPSAPQLSAGYIINPEATVQCEFCSVQIADTFLAQNGIYWSDRWRNFGIMWSYVLFNVAVAVLLYYVFRVRTNQKKTGGSVKSKVTKAFNGGKFAS